MKIQYHVPDQTIKIQKLYISAVVQPIKEINEIDVHTLSVLEGHDNYIDLAAWAPHEDILVTASSDK